MVNLSGICWFLLISLLQTFLNSHLIAKCQHFNGKAKSYGFDIAVSADKSTLSLEQPQFSVKDPGGKYKYAKTHASIGPSSPYVDKEMVMVEAKGPKLDVKGEYPRLKSKAKTKASNKDDKDPSTDIVSRESKHESYFRPVSSEHQITSGVLDKKYVSKRTADNDELPRPVKEIFHDSRVQSYANDMRSKVSHVVNEAKEVLSNTGRVVSGLRRVISGAKKLTEFTNNAVKFAKYFAMEPSNATVDYFEEKAVIAVLQAQKAAAEAKIAAVIAREAAKKANVIIKRMRKTYKHANVKKLFKAAKFVELQAAKSAAAARETSSREREAKNYAINTDKALRKMVEVSRKEMNKKPEEEEVQQSENANEENVDNNLNDEKLLQNSNDNKNSSDNIKPTKASTTKAPTKKEQHEQNVSSGDEEEQDRESIDLRNLYENVKATIAATERNNVSNVALNQTMDLLPTSSLQGGGDENEVIANDYEGAIDDNGSNEKPVKPSAVGEHGVKAEPAAVEEQKKVINDGRLSVVVTVKRKKLPRESKIASQATNVSTQNSMYDPFNFKSVVRSAASNEHNESMEPINLDTANIESIRSTIARLPEKRRWPLQAETDLQKRNYPTIKQFVFTKSNPMQKTKFDQGKKRSRIPEIYSYESSEDTKSLNNPESIWLPNMNG